MNRKAVSPVIAVLLLIVIAVAASILTYVWVTGYIGTIQQQGGTEQLREKIKIDGVQYDGTTLTVYVRNIGEVSVTVDAIYVIKSDGTITAQTTGLAQTINTSQVSSMSLSVSSLSSGTYTIKVVTEKGMEATYVWTYTP